MCFGSKPKVDNSALKWQQQQAAKARSEENERKARVGEGLDKIAAIFEGGSVVTEKGRPGKRQLVTLRPGDEGYQNVGTGPLADIWNRVRNRKYMTVGATPDVTQSFQGMQPLLDQRRAAMEGYYMPQLENQFGDAQDGLVYALSRAGLLNSSAAGEKQGKLTEQYGLQRGDILSRIASDLAGTKTKMNQQRSAIEAGLRASGDQSAAAQQAMQAATTFNQDSPRLDPLGPLFYGIAETVGAANRGRQVQEIKQMSTPRSLNGGSAARVVG